MRTSGEILVERYRYYLPRHLGPGQPSFRVVPQPEQVGRALFRVQRRVNALCFASQIQIRERDDFTIFTHRTGDIHEIMADTAALQDLFAPTGGQLSSDVVSDLQHIARLH